MCLYRDSSVSVMHRGLHSVYFRDSSVSVLVTAGCIVCISEIVAYLCW